MTSTATSASVPRARCGAASRCSKCSSFTAATTTASASTSSRSDPTGVTPVAYNPAFFTFGRAAEGAAGAGEPRLRGLSRALPAADPGYKDELIVLSRRLLFPCARPQPALWRLGTRARDRHRRAPAARNSRRSPISGWCARNPADRTLTIYALLDSRSVAGAYQFEIRPGAITQVEVHCELYPRRAIAKLGVAPLTSMFLYGEDATGRHFDDYRPRGARQRRPAWRRPARAVAVAAARQSARAARESLHGREPARLRPDPARSRLRALRGSSKSQYQLRPSYWVQPLGSWGKGGVELVEIPSDEEIHDNIVAYWVPDQTPSRPANRSPSLTCCRPICSNAALAARRPRGRDAQRQPRHGRQQGSLCRPARGACWWTSPAAISTGWRQCNRSRRQSSADNGHIEAVTVQRMPMTGAWRVAIVVTPRPKKPVDLHCYLTLYGEVLTETWVYQWTP